MSKTKLWSLQFTCRRLAREARSLGRSIDSGGSAAREIEQHLTQAAQLVQASLDQLGAAPKKQGAILDVAQLAFSDNAWASQSPLTDYKAPQESAPSPQHRLGLRTNGQFVATPDLITFLCSLKKTGVLLVDTVDERFTVELDQGDIVHAHSDGAPDGERLGDVLVEHGVIEATALEALLAEGIRGRFGGRLGARLLDRKMATQEQLLAALETQIRRLFQRLFPAQATEIVFWEGACMWGEQSMRLNATMLLLDGARAIDESSRDESEVHSVSSEEAEAALSVLDAAEAALNEAAAEVEPAVDAEPVVEAAAPPAPAPAADAAPMPVAEVAPAADAVTPPAEPTVVPTDTASPPPSAELPVAAPTSGAEASAAEKAAHPSHPLSPTPGESATAAPSAPVADQAPADDATDAADADARG